MKIILNPNIAIFVITALALSSCGNKNSGPTAYGNFEATEYSLDVELAGRIIQYTVEEGSPVKKGEIIAVIDTVQADLKRQQLMASIDAVRARLPEQGIQLAVYEEKLDRLNTERNRVARLVKENAAPSKNLDDIDTEIAVTQKQRKAAASQLGTQSKSLLAEMNVLKVQLAQVDDQIRRCLIHAPVNGILLSKYMEEGELAAPGKPLGKVAAVNPIILKAYFDEPSLRELKIGGEVNVFVDGAENSLKSYQGKVQWISDEAEFTPKMIQTRDERVTQVYAVKIAVPNDGSLKIGMPAEVKLASPDTD